MLEAFILSSNIDNLSPEFLDAPCGPFARIAGGSQECDDIEIGLPQTLLVKAEVLLAVI
jgi:hypothetical protein